jgi:hypothetical protein
MLIVAVIAFVVVGLAGVYFILEAIPFAITEPSSVDVARKRVLRTSTSGDLEQLGFTPVGYLEFSSVGDKVASFWQSAYCSADRSTLAVFGTMVAREQGAFLTVWEDGRVVISRWPKVRLIFNRRTTRAIARISPTLEAAYTRHVEDVETFRALHGNELSVKDMRTSRECLKVAAATYRRMMGGAYKMILRLGLIGLGAIIAAAIS